MGNVNQELPKKIIQFDKATALAQEDKGNNYLQKDQPLSRNQNQDHNIPHFDQL